MLTILFCTDSSSWCPSLFSWASPSYLFKMWFAVDSASRSFCIQVLRFCMSLPHPPVAFLEDEIAYICCNWTSLRILVQTSRTAHCILSASIGIHHPLISNSRRPHLFSHLYISVNVSSRISSLLVFSTLLFGDRSDTRGGVGVLVNRFSGHSLCFQILLCGQTPEAQPCWRWALGMALLLLSSHLLNGASTRSWWRAKVRSLPLPELDGLSCRRQ